MGHINSTRGVSFTPSGRNSKAEWLKRQALKAAEAAQIEECYREHAPTQVFHQDEMTGVNTPNLGIDLTNRKAA